MELAQCRQLEVNVTARQHRGPGRQQTEDNASRRPADAEPRRPSAVVGHCRLRLCIHNKHRRLHVISANIYYAMDTHTHTHTRLTALFRDYPTLGLNPSFSANPPYPAFPFSPSGFTIWISHTVYCYFLAYPSFYF